MKKSLALLSALILFLSLTVSETGRAAVTCEAIFQPAMILTVPLQKVLRGKAKSVSAYLVADLGSMTPARFVALAKSQYGIDAQFKTAKTDGGLQNIFVTAAPSELIRFLGNPFAQQSVRWVGLSSGDRYIAAALNSVQSEGVNSDTYAPAFLEQFGNPSRRNRSDIGFDRSPGDPRRAGPAFDPLPVSRDDGPDSSF